MDETWNDVVGWEGYYQVSDLGRVKSVERVIIRSDGGIRQYKDRLLKLNPNKATGYVFVKLCRDGLCETHAVHRLVAAAFLGPRPVGMEVCHGPGGQDDNRAANLRYDTHQANAGEDRIRAGTSRRGESHGKVKMTEADVIGIRSDPTVSLGEWARRLGVARCTVFQARSGKTWKHLTISEV